MNEVGGKIRVILEGTIKGMKRLGMIFLKVWILLGSIARCWEFSASEVGFKYINGALGATGNRPDGRPRRAVFAYGMPKRGPSKGRSSRF